MSLIGALTELVTSEYAVALIGQSTE